MATKRKILPRFDGWCFAIVNNKLAEIFFENDDKKKKSVVWAHCYVERSEYKTKKLIQILKNVGSPTETKNILKKIECTGIPQDVPTGTSCG